MNTETQEYLKTMQQARANELDESGENITTYSLLLDAAAAAELLGFTRAYFYELNKSGRLGPEPIYFGKRSRWSRFDLMDWVRKGCPNREKWLCFKERSFAIV